MPCKLPLCYNTHGEMDGFVLQGTKTDQARRTVLIFHYQLSKQEWLLYIVRLKHSVIRSIRLVSVILYHISFKIKTQTDVNLEDAFARRQRRLIACECFALALPFPRSFEIQPMFIFPWNVPPIHFRTILCLVLPINLAYVGKSGSFLFCLDWNHSSARFHNNS